MSRAEKVGELKWAAKSRYADYWIRSYPKRTEVVREEFGGATSWQGCASGAGHKKRAVAAAKLWAKMDDG